MRHIKKYKIYLFLFIASLLTVIIHEFGHYIMGTILGYNMLFDFNGTRPLIGSFSNKIHLFLVLFSGISFTIIQSYLSYYLMKKLNYKSLYYLILTPFLYRIIPYLISLIYPNRLMYQDEAKIANLLNINIYLVFFIIIGVLFYNCFRASKKYKLNYKRHIKLSVVSIVSFFIIIKLNQLLMFRI